MISKLEETSLLDSVIHSYLYQFDLQSMKVKRSVYRGNSLIFTRFLQQQHRASELLQQGLFSDNSQTSRQAASFAIQQQQQLQQLQEELND